MDAAPRSRTRQPACRDRTGARRRRRPDHRGQDRGRADGFPDASRLRDRGAQVRARRACAAGRAGRRTSRMRMRCMSAPRSRRARATTPRRGGCWRPASRCAAGSATRSTSRRRCPPSRWSGCTRATRRGRARARKRRSRIFRQLGDQDRRGDRARHLGEICHVLSRTTPRRAVISSSASPSRARSATASSRANASACSASSRWTQGDLPAARARFARSLEVCRERGEQARRGDGAVVDRERRTSPSGDADRARTQARRGAARVPGVRDERARCWAASRTMAGCCNRWAAPTQPPGSTGRSTASARGSH